MEDGEGDCDVVDSACGSWIEDVDSEKNGDCVDVVESCGRSWLEDVDSEKDGDCVDVVESCGRSWLEVDSERVGDFVVVWVAAAKLVV